MAPAPINPNSTSTTEGDQMQKQLDHEIREMISSLIDGLAQLQHSRDRVHKQPVAGSSQLQHQQLPRDEEDHGMRIITLSGSNTGALMRGELDDNYASVHGHHGDGHGRPFGQNDHGEDGLCTYVNSNFQAINNSLMLGGSYSTNDPGVHLDISDFIQHPLHRTHGNIKHAAKSKPEKEEIETSKSDHQYSDD